MTPESLNGLFRAFGDSTRLRMLHLLRRGELCVADLVDVLEIPQPTASRHLQYLRRADLVDARRDGRWCYYSLAPAGSVFQQRLLDCLATCFTEVPELREDAARLAALERRGGCCDVPARRRRAG